MWKNLILQKSKFFHCAVSISVFLFLPIEPYTPLEVRRHVRQFLDLQNPLDNENACRSEEGQAPSFLIPASFETENIRKSTYPDLV